MNPKSWLISYNTPNFIKYGDCLNPQIINRRIDEIFYSIPQIVVDKSFKLGERPVA